MSETQWAAFRRSYHCLLDGGVIACPTETVYGLSCMAGEEQAVERILDLKRRSACKKGVILIAANAAQVEGWIDMERVGDLHAVLKSWPGPVTWVFHATRALPPWLSGAGATIAVRVSAHPLLRLLCECTGPLVSTSANPANRPPARDSRRVRSYFGMGVDRIHPGRTPACAQPSEIRLASNGSVLRAGQPGALPSNLPLIGNP